MYELPTSYITEVGSTLDVQYATAYLEAGETTGRELAVLCSTDVYSGNGLQGTFSGFTTTGDMSFPCSVVGGDGSLPITFNIQVTGEYYDRRLCLYIIYMQLNGSNHLFASVSTYRGGHYNR